MLINNLSKREKIAVFGCVLLVGAAVFYNFGVEPFVGYWGVLHSEARAKKEAFRKDVRILASRHALQKTYLKYSKYLNSKKDEGEAIAEVLEYLETVSQKDSCFITNIKPAGIKDLGTHKEILIDISSEASVHSFLNFLYHVENASDMLLKVKRFTLSAKSGQPGTLKGSFLIGKVSIN